MVSDDGTKLLNQTFCLKSVEVTKSKVLIFKKMFIRKTLMS